MLTRSPESKRPATERWEALDITRGWSMLVLIVITPFRSVFDGEGHHPVPTFIAMQLTHARWAGIRYIDIGLAAFVFMLGFSVPLALDARVRKNPKGSPLGHVVKRSLALFGLGMFASGGMLVPLASRAMFLDVLQRLALCYLAVSVAYIFLSRRAQAAACAAIVVIYGLASALLPFPGSEAGHYARSSNLAAFVDHTLLGVNSLAPEGFFSSIGAVCSCWLGSITCQALRGVPRDRATRHFLVLGVGALALGLLLSSWIPLVKRLWTVSYLVLTYGTTCLHLGFFSVVTARWKMRWLYFPAFVIGAHSLAPYLVHELLPLENYAQRLVGGEDLGRLLGASQPYLVALVMAVVNWLPAYFLYRQAARRQDRARDESPAGESPIHTRTQQ